MDERKQKLIEALKEERQRFIDNGHNTTEHDVTLKYLETGSYNVNPDKYPLLDACINDYETTLSDYGV